MNSLRRRKTDRISDTHIADAVRHRVTRAAEARTRTSMLRFAANIGGGHINRLFSARLQVARQVKFSQR